jgi:hypothetical protein
LAPVCLYRSKCLTAGSSREAGIWKWGRIPISGADHGTSPPFEHAVPRAASHRRAELDAQLKTLTERLYDIEDLLDRPIGATVALICADLGLTPDWELWAVED